jgi:hypothetical protein
VVLISLQSENQRQFRIVGILDETDRGKHNVESLGNYRSAIFPTN